MENKPQITFEKCLEVVRKLNEGSDQSEELLLHKARLFYFLNRLSFWNEIPILLDIIKFESKLAVEKTGIEYYDKEKVDDIFKWILNECNKPLAESSLFLFRNNLLHEIRQRGIKI